MNDESTRGDLSVIDQHTIGSTAMIFSDNNFERAQKFAEAMASAAVSVPVHFRGKPGDCLAIVMQAAQWNMNPFAVAQKTHLTQGGALGYEAQLVNAVVVSSGALKGQPEFTFIGNWDKILGKVEERKSDKGGKYYVATYSKADEAGLGVICTGTLRGESEPREITVMMSQCYPRFSTQWATDPQQQITYVAVRKFARRYAPGAILGVYTAEELEDQTPREMGNINPETGEVTPPSGKQSKSSKPELPPCPQGELEAQFAKWQKAIDAGKKTGEDFADTAATRFTLTADQRAQIIALKPTPAIDGEFVTNYTDTEAAQ